MKTFNHYNKKILNKILTDRIEMGFRSAITSLSNTQEAQGLRALLKSKGILKTDPDSSKILNLFTISIVKQGRYYVTITEKLFEKFSVTFIARGKEDALNKLGRRIFSFVGVNRQELSKLQKDFYMWIWFEIFMRTRLEAKKQPIQDKLDKVTKEMRITTEHLNFCEKAISKFKIKRTEISKKKSTNPKKAKKYTLKYKAFTWRIDHAENDMQQDIIKQKRWEQEKAKIDREMRLLEKIIKSPEFIVSKTKLGLREVELNNFNY